MLAEIDGRPADDWRSRVVTDFSSTCRVVVRDENFLLHSCNTLGGVSGSPVLRFNRSRESYEMIGIHTGASEWLARWNQCASNFAGGFPNYAVAVSPRMLDAVKE